MKMGKYIFSSVLAICFTLLLVVNISIDYQRNLIEEEKASALVDDDSGPLHTIVHNKHWFISNSNIGHKINFFIHHPNCPCIDPEAHNRFFNR